MSSQPLDLLDVFSFAQEKMSNSFLDLSAHFPPLDSIRRINIYLTTSCNLHCKHCALGDRLENSITMDYYRAIEIANYFASTFNLEEIVILGGEPTLVPHFSRFVHYLAKNCMLKLSVMTNGVDISAFSNILPHYFDYVFISIDGLSSSSHDAIRGRGTLKRVLMNLHALIQEGYNIGIIFTVTRLNAHEVIDALYFFDTLGVKLVNFHVVSNNGNARENPHLQIDPEIWRDIVQRIDETQQHLKNAKVKRPRLFLTEREYERELEKGYHCLLREIDRLHIFPDGRVYNCCLMFDTPLNRFLYTNELVENRFSEKTLYESNPNTSCVAAEYLETHSNNSKYITICVHWK